MSEKKLSEPEVLAEVPSPEQLTLPFGEVWEGMLFYAGTRDRNLETKQAMAEELTSMGFSETQTRRILHIGRRDSAGSQNTSTPNRSARRLK